MSKTRFTVQFFTVVIILFLILTGCTKNNVSENTLITQQTPPKTQSQTVEQSNSQINEISEPDSPLAPIPANSKITVRELYQGIQAKKEWQIFDTRNYSVYALAHVPSAQNIPLASLENRINEISKKTQVIFIFFNDEDAEKGWQILISNGYDPNLVKVLEGGMDQWEKAGYKSENGLPAGC
ncbi:MAG: rhodanese-like domain-containing protein [Dehalobacter sp.]|nr:rhodanese-like domain-containing protein [Dehalobacter sp.]